MMRANPAQIDMFRRLLAHEAAAAGAHGRATTTAGRVYDKLHTHVATIVGAVGVQSLFTRSAKLVQGEFTSFAEVSDLESTKLRERLHMQNPPLATESVAALFGTFFTLLTTLIGERLTAQLLRGAWPTFEDMAPEKTE